MRILATLKFVRVEKRESFSAFGYDYGLEYLFMAAGQVQKIIWTVHCLPSAAERT